LNQTPAGEFGGGGGTENPPLNPPPSLAAVARLATRFAGEFSETNLFSTPWMSAPGMGRPSLFLLYLFAIMG